MEFLREDKHKDFLHILDFLETAYSQRGVYRSNNLSKESAMDVICLNFTKVVNDTRAILLLAQQELYIQAGILCRNTIDACNLMMHIAFEGADAPIYKLWADGQRISHWKLIKRINTYLDRELDLSSYEKTRKTLDDFVHANYSALQLYPAQAPGPTQIDSAVFTDVTFWKPLMDLFLVSCLLVVPIIVSDLEEEANRFLDSMDVH